ncbi:MAG: LemA family protein [Deltaproteobacteria bacterium RIFCSPLOWO2_01_44_7]|nr:MAG: LemA family protein [Deltaproteobacteria bacterium RIFCSPHIGHO2_01_FULL_43_49]OGQ14938.1 MAG: LemA family protein [Deltaproteobacteria bacterium RIFCSPHIGHO2_02_FULL_44_53]OGQ29559.1 MAG: LemA family protein [Deltaproteobacteria bacterium RIFCSPHIGHO2_12_FULL_44_21]OGQ31050.1 MAG: LemA family protein [Deltaproteobacteria bacterium RIFCSPLOWO2_01_FULL_45_74]OGQ39818.1 MAG: LemA family protein [Deltaproteobacteria bacterium RIFCSPLOWO2_01_44_7]OGQ42652.1 MAG: LemA family protein [Deltapr
MKKTLWIVLAVVVIVALMGVGKYNQIVKLNQGVQEGWSQVENVLQRRNDLIPNLVETVKGYAAHEQKVFIDVTEARAKVGQAQTIPDKIAANDQLTAALGRLLVVAENYPQLKANENFLALQDELAGTENRISVERRRFNEQVNAYNTFAQQFPNNIVVRFTVFPKQQVYFKAEEAAKEVPKVKF